MIMLVNFDNFNKLPLSKNKNIDFQKLEFKN